MDTNTIPNKEIAAEVITKVEVAKRLKVSARMVEIMVNDGRIPIIRIGRAVRFNWNAILEALEAASAK